MTDLEDFFKARELDPFLDADGSDRGTKDNPSIWLFGIEHGMPKNYKPSLHDDSYSIEIQSQFPFNRNAFKLLAAILEGNCAQGSEFYSFAKKFADEKKPFVKGSSGFFKGNLFSIGCNTLNDWSEENTKKFGTKAEYTVACQKRLYSIMQEKIKEHAPSLFIGVGTTRHKDFAQIVLGTENPELSTIDLEIDNRIKKKIFFNIEGPTKLFIIPHLSRGLTGNASIYKVGRFIRDMRNQKS